MFDKELIKLMGENKKYVVYVVLLMILGMLANIGITASICWAVYLLIEKQPALMYIYPAITAVFAINVRYIASRLTGDLKDVLGRKVKKGLRSRTYMRGDRLAHFARAACLRSAHSRVHCGCIQIRQKDICKVLG